ncbi:hypothetical protein NFHSH190041_16930 [Shewanella sp. NFH-SH190041]|uniref:hypothetical protein n=1 Tax=Shewanella sp. NFH-SH190041 TaxID=2950245 RepID=UPI0021C4AC64|nr:hypothetical protein [Shewanella sp. NFH-SH190041]BDM64241.1 hypothetical protein NFHSH190041_16930 [Shewanella sp. NFH-SH190041]
MDQAKRQLALNSAIKGKGVRFAISCVAGQKHFDKLYQDHFPKEMKEGILAVYHIPGNGMK